MNMNDRDVRSREREPQQSNFAGTFVRPRAIPKALPHARVRAKKASTAPPTFYRMLRRGTFAAHEASPNQYVRENHEVYYYTIQVVWEGTVKLDYRDFILDNADLTSFIANMKLMGSGEMMMRAMMEQVNARLIELGIPPIACKITVRGSVEENRNDAYLEYTQSRPEHLGLLQ